MITVKNLVSGIRFFMEKNGFVFSKKGYYKIQNDIAFCIQLDSPGGLVYVTYFIMPLYIPCQNRYYTYGNRMNSLECTRLAPLSKYASSAEMDEWCSLLCTHLENMIFPFFEEVSSPARLSKSLQNKRKLVNTFFMCPAINISRLKLFNYLYLKDYENLSLEVKQHLYNLQNSTFLTESIRQRYMKELESLNFLLTKDELDRENFITSTIADTLRNCF